MKRLFNFYLKGVGYLRSVELTSMHATACIEVSDERIRGEAKKSSKPDQIILECQIPTRLKQKLQRLQYRCQTEESMAVRFRAIYDRFGVCHTGQDPDEPLNLLNLQCQLINIVVL